MKKTQFTRRTFFRATAASALVASLAPNAPAAETTTLPPLQQLPGLDVDVLVCGGGPSGMAAAVLAARQNASVLLAERYGRLGGMAVNARVGPLMGRIKSKFVHEVLQHIGGRNVDPEKLDLQYAQLVHDAGADLLLHAWALAPIMNDNAVQGAYLITKAGILPVRAKITVDATGDGDVAFQADAPFEKGRPEDKLLQPMSIMFTLAGVDPQNALYCGSEEQAMQIQLPAGTWCDIVTRANEAGRLPKNVGVVRLYRSARPGQAVVNATQVNYVDGADPRDLTRAELEGRKQAYQILDFLRDHGPGYENAYISAMPACIGVRETRRFLGREYLVKEDCLAGRKRDDAVVWNADFVIDIHNPTGTGQANLHGTDATHGSAQRVKPYDIPYGCLVPRDTDGLLLAGRCISGSHEAHASYRVQCIAMATGAAAGAAAALAAQNHLQPKNVDVKAIQKILT